MRRQYHKDTFDKISPAKRRRVLQTAVREFSRYGYEAVSINHIAEKADISVGSIYTYFKSKQDLFLAVAAEGYKLLLNAEADFGETSGELRQDLYRLFEMTVRYSKKHANMLKLKHMLSTEEMSYLSSGMANQFDEGFLHIYHSILEAAIERGELAKDLNINLAAWTIDNMLDSLQLAVSNRYHKRRLALYLGSDETIEDETLIQALTDFVYQGLRQSL